MTDAELPQRWWARRLPPVIDAVVYGVYAAFGVAAWVWLSVMLYVPVNGWNWLLLGVAAVVVVTLVAFIWFFTPIYPLLEYELPLPDGATAAESRAVNRLRSLAGGSHLGTVMLAVFYPCLFAASAVSGAVQGETGASRLLPAVVSFAVVVLWGSRIVSRMPLVTPIWARRLRRGGAATESPEAAPRVRGITPATSVLVAAAVMLGLVAPMAVGSALAAVRDIDANGRWQWFESGDSMQLANGVELTVPLGWKGSLVTGDPLNAKWGIKQHAILTRGEYTAGGAVHLDVLESDSIPGVRDPAVLAESARESYSQSDPREVYGPSAVEYAGWSGTAAVAEDDLAMRTSGTLRYSVWILLRTPAGDEFFISTDNDVLGTNRVSEPERLVPRVTDLLEIRLSGD